jgi:hypothetical protein
LGDVPLVCLVVVAAAVVRVHGPVGDGDLNV